MRVHRVGVFLLGGLMVALGAAVGLSGQARDPVKGAAILAEARQALGGEDKLAAVQRLRANGTIRRGAGNVNLEGSLEFFIERPNKFRRDENLTIDAAGQEIARREVVVGSESWEESRRGGGVIDFGGGGGGGGDFGGGGGDAGGGDAIAGDGGGRVGGQPGAAAGDRPGGAAPADPEAQNRARQTEFARILLAVLLTSDTPVNWIGTAKSPDGEADVLEVETADGTATRLLIDSKTRLPLMLTWTGVPQDAFAALVGRAGLGGRGGGRGGRGGGFQGRGFPGRGGDPPTGAPGQGRGGRGSIEPTTLQMFLSDYKVVDGIRLPHLMTRGANGEINEEWIVRNYRVNPNFNADTFSR